MAFAAEPMFPGDLADAAARFAADAAARAGGPGARARAWRDAVAMGWPALLVDEARGGAGGTLADLGAVVEGCARHAAGLPLVRRCAHAATLLAGVGGAVADEALRALAAGAADVDVADGARLTVAASASGGVRLGGWIDGVDAELPATHVLVAAAGHVLLVPRAALPQAAQRFAAIDGARRADVAVDGVELPASAVVGAGPEADAAARAAADVATLATAIEMVATLGASVERCIEHLSTRVQFGVALSTFQVLRHRVVDLYVDFEGASVLLARVVHDAAAARRVAPRDAALVKLHVNQLARRGAEASIQLHGGMGMTAELPAARLARRLLCAEFEHGERPALLERLRTAPAPA